MLRTLLEDYRGAGFGFYEVFLGGLGPMSSFV